MNQKICVLGLGYIGLPTAALFSINSYSVVGVDIDKKKVNSIKKGIIDTKEPGLKKIVKEALDSEKLTVQDKIEEADVFVIAVPTPLNKEKKKAELKFVESACNMIKSVLKKDNLVVLESTVPPNTCKNIIIPILEKSGLKAGDDFLIAHCPERAIPGDAIKELKKNDRIIGSINHETYGRTKQLYSCFCKGKMHQTDLTTAECVKLMENTYRDANIALANEFAKISKDFEINVWEAIELANNHPRVNIHSPGPGVGGHCIAIDPWFLTENTKNSKLVKEARYINDSMPKFVFDIIQSQVKNIKNPIISILGVAYKANVDDTRESPALEVIKLCKNYNVKVHDPYVKNFKYNLDSLDEALTDSDCAVIITNHKEFHNLSPKNFEKVRNKVILDTRNCINKKYFKGSGFKIITLGDYKD